MPRKLKVVDVTTEPSAAEPVVTEQTLDATTVEVPLAEPAVAEAPQVEKKKRAPRAPKPKPVPEPEPVAEEEPVRQSFFAEAEPTPATATADAEPEQPEPEQPKSIKTVELVECPDCHKKLTARTLKYSHQAVCPAKNPKAISKTKREINQDEVVKPVPDIDPEVERALSPEFRYLLNGVRNRTRRQRYAHLVSQAF